MASATAKVVEKTVKVTESVTLELTAEEAEWLRGYVGRSTDMSGFSSAIYSALDAPAEAPEDRPIQVGDKVRITEVGEGDSVYLNETGKIRRVDEDDPDLMYAVVLPDGDHVWVKSVERVND